MFKDIPLIIGNAATFCGATFATINHNDINGWALMIVGISVTVGAGFHKHKREKFASMRERIALCKDCRASGVCPDSCVVSKKYRPKDCHLNK